MLERSPENIGLTRLTDVGIDDIEIWHVNLAAARIHLARVESHLTEDEHERANNVLHPRIREQFVLVRGLLREILAERINHTTSHSVTASSLRFSYSRFGKPFLTEYQALQFNVTHSRNSALIALTLNHPIGVDIQWVDPHLDIEKMKDAFSEPENDYLQSLDRDTRQIMSFQLWALKEAYCKADGRGFSLKLSNIQIQIPLNKPDFPIIWDEKRGVWLCGKRIKLHPLTLPIARNFDYVAAIATGEHAR